MKTRWIAACLCVGLLLMVSGYAEPQRQPPADPPPESEPGGTDETTDDQAPDFRTGVSVFRSGINYVRVDAFVTDDDGNPVFDLTQDDFEVYEDGVPQTVDSFQVIRVDRTPELSGEPLTSVGVTRSDQELAASRPDVRVFVIFLDDYHVREGNSIRARRMLIEFLENDLIPTDLVGVMYPLMPVSDVRLTRDHEAVINAVQQFEGFKYRYDVRNLYEARYNFYPTEIVERVRNEGVAVRAPRADDDAGRSPRGAQVGAARDRGLHELRAAAVAQPECGHAGGPGRQPRRPRPVRGRQPLEETFAFFEGSSMLGDLRRVYETASRFNASIYAVDPRGLAVFEFDMDQPQISYRTDQRALRFTQDTLRILAEETGGRAIVNQNDLRPGLQQMLDDASGYYLLGYNSSGAPTDGEFHEIEVRLRRDGLRVRAREGYWAVTERDVQRSLVARINRPPKAVDVALSALAEPRRGRLVRTWVGTSRAENGKTRVTFVWEPTESRGRRDEASRVLVTAMGDSGGAYFRGRVPEQTRSSRRGTTRRRSRRAAAAPAPGHARGVRGRPRDDADEPGHRGRGRRGARPRPRRDRHSGLHRSRPRSEHALLRARAERAGVESAGVRLGGTAHRVAGLPPHGPVAPAVRRLHAGRCGAGGRGEPAEPGRRRNVSARRPCVGRGAAHQAELAPSFLAPGEYIIEIRATLGDGEASEMIAFRLGA